MLFTFLFSETGRLTISNLVASQEHIEIYTPLIVPFLNLK